MRERISSDNDPIPVKLCDPGAYFPVHTTPRVWFLTSVSTPLSIRLIRTLLEHGDYIVATFRPQEIEDGEDGGNSRFQELINECKSEKRQADGWDSRIRGIQCDGRSMGQYGAATAEAIQVFGRIDILLCCSAEVVVGTVEELSQSHVTQSLVREQFETTFFSPINYIRALLPHFREKNIGHIMILSCTSGHIGTPGISMFCASTRALEGYCDSLAYEIAPFNIKVTIIQANQEIIILTNNIKFASQLPPYENGYKSVTGLRDILVNLLNRNPETVIDCSTQRCCSQIVSKNPRLSNESEDKLVMETVLALIAIGGHENPPARHIVGLEAVASIKERLKTVSEELEDYVKVGYAVDIYRGDSGHINTTGESVDLNLLRDVD